jgi:hypothetical protein
MKKFPNLIDKQVAVVFADANTGHVLDDKFNLVIDENQNAYSIFETLDDALISINQAFKLKVNTEAIIYNQQEDVLYCLNNLS